VTSRRFAMVAAIGLVSAAIGLGSVSFDGQTRPDSSPGGQPLTIFDREEGRPTVGEPGFAPTRLHQTAHECGCEVDPATPQTTDIGQRCRRVRASGSF
jgi:hypothetical protein